MNKTKIEWCDYTVNPVKGYCPMACPYCYARRMYDRFGWGKTIRYDAFQMKSLSYQYKKPPSKIFVGSTMELFGDWVSPEWLKDIFYWCRVMSQHTFIFLTKQPQNLVEWSPFPDNAWLGVSCVNDARLTHAWRYLRGVEASVKFISFEPLQGWIMHHVDIVWTLKTANIGWVIIGSETGNRKEKPPLEQVQGWAREIIQAADEAGIPVFTKDNLKLPANEVRRGFPL